MLMWMSLIWLTETFLNFQDFTVLLILDFVFFGGLPLGLVPVFSVVLLGWGAMAVVLG